VGRVGYNRRLPRFYHSLRVSQPLRAVLFELTFRFSLAGLFDGLPLFLRVGAVQIILKTVIQLISPFLRLGLRPQCYQEVSPRLPAPLLTRTPSYKLELILYPVPVVPEDKVLRVAGEVVGNLVYAPVDVSLPACDVGETVSSD
jgi:hypothetical protein